MSSLAKTISEVFGVPSKPTTGPVPASLIRQWMKSRDLEALGAIAAYVSDPLHYGRIEPGLSFDEVFSFMLSYLERCIREDPEGRWASSRYLAAYESARWFRRLWMQRSTESSKLADLKNWLARLLRSGDDDVRDAVINGALEHIFEDRSMAEYFLDWRPDPVLAAAYEEALQWADPSTM